MKNYDTVAFTETTRLDSRTGNEFCRVKYLDGFEEEWEHNSNGRLVGYWNSNGDWFKVYYDGNDCLVKQEGPLVAEEWGHNEHG